MEKYLLGVFVYAAIEAIESFYRNRPSLSYEGRRRQTLFTLAKRAGHVGLAE